MTEANSPLLIRKATLPDVDLIQVIAYATWPVTYNSILTQESLNYMLQHFYSKPALEQQMNKGHEFFIAESDDAAVGFASISEVEDGVYKLHKLYVLPHQQKTGAGKALMNYTIELAKAAGAKEFILNVNRNNPAKGFYERLGFTIDRDEDVDIGNGFVQEDYVMKLSLK